MSLVWEEEALMNIHKYALSISTLGAEFIIPLSSSSSFSRQGPSLGWLVDFPFSIPLDSFT